MDLADFRRQFLYLRLEDEAIAEPDSNCSAKILGKAEGTPHPFTMYYRREKGHGKRRGIYEEWGLGDTNLGTGDTCPELIRKEEYSDS